MLASVEATDHRGRGPSRSQEEVGVTDAHVVGAVEVELLELEADLKRSLSWLNAFIQT